MSARYKKRQAEIVRNRILVLLVVVAVLLVVIIAVTAPDKPDDTAAPTPSSSDTAPSQSPDSGSEPIGSTGSSDSDPSSEASPSSSTSDESSAGTSASTSSSQSASSAPSSSSSEASTGEQDKYYEKSLPMLVNPTNKIPEGYLPELADIGNGYKLQARAAVAFKDMMAKAQKDGVSLWTVSAYRSHEKQTTNFNNKIKEYENLGYTAEQAYVATAKLIAVPGTSEHSLGYAVDLNSLETSFENTKQFTWLTNNCADFGFVLRYPKDKTEITEISYEPWHYRYVGSNHARIIMEHGLSLEEYLSGDY